jgi:hypothetical protein
MDEEDDDFYDPADPQPTTQVPNETNKPAGAATEVKTGDLEEGEEEEVEEEEDDEVRISLPY